ncbi:MAG: hypothetical protein QOH63_1774 [Acidobacteriota bacterium]|jgi:hypothetical protein|nr:hypothetical protein [Acidobacteriota bacterium]
MAESLVCQCAAFVCLATVSYGDDVHESVCIIYFVDHPIITDTDTPAVLSAYKFTAA